MAAENVTEFPKRGHTSKERTVDNLVRMEEIRNRLNMTKGEFSIALGYVTPGGYDAATKAQGATLHQLLAAEGVEHRYRKENTSPMRYALLVIHPDGKIVSTAIDKPQTANLMGKDYLLVPTK